MPLGRGRRKRCEKKRPPDSRDAQPASWHKAMAFVLTSAHEPCANPDFPLRKQKRTLTTHSTQCDSTGIEIETAMRLERKDGE